MDDLEQRLTGLKGPMLEALESLSVPHATVHIDQDRRTDWYGDHYQGFRMTISLCPPSDWPSSALPPANYGRIELRLTCCPYDPKGIIGHFLLSGPAPNGIAGAWLHDVFRLTIPYDDNVLPALAELFKTRLRPMLRKCEEHYSAEPTA